MSAPVRASCFGAGAEGAGAEGGVAWPGEWTSPASRVPTGSV